MTHTEFFIAFAVLLATGCTQSQKPAEVVIRNGTIYTANDQQPTAEALAVSGGKIVFVGSASDVAAYVGPNTKVIDLKGNTATPGLTDSHYHLYAVGQRERTLSLEDTKNTSVEDFLQKVKTAASKKKPGEWLTGRGWIESEWPLPVFPTRSQLDQVAPNNPVYLIMRDGRTHEPNGMITDNAKGLIESKIPPETEADHEQNLEAGIARTLAQGWTTVHVPGGSFDEIGRLKKMYESGAAKLRIYYAVSGPGPEARTLLDQGAMTGLYGDRLTIRSIKLYMDGSLGSMSAALLDNYQGTDSKGFFVNEPQTLYPLIEEALKKGIQIMTHAIGDRGNREILDLYEKALAAVPPDQRKVKDPRFRIEHAQIFNPDDLPRPAKLGVICSMQPSHAITDLHFAPLRLGIDRLKGAYAWRTFIDSGVKVAGGSDAPVERGDPRIEFYAAVARKDLKGFQGEGWHPELKVTRAEALKMFTAWPAYASFEEDLKGTLEPGKLADLTVLSKDIMTVPESEILTAQTMMTIINGEVVYEK